MVLNKLVPVFVVVLFGTVPAVASAGLAPLSDDEMQDVSGAGIAVALDDFRFMAAPTSYFEQVGVAPTNACSGSGSSAGNTHCWRRGDLRWFGVNISSASGSGSHWNEGVCSAGSLSCPRGGQISWFSPFDNPYLMRAASPLGIAYSGAIVNADTANPDKTIYEFLAPTSQPDYTFSFWGEIESGATRVSQSQTLSQGTGDVLKSQTIIRGNAAGSVFRIFRFTEPGNDTFGLFYHSRLQGDFRFSVAQGGALQSDTPGVPVPFDTQEGLHFYNVEAFLPFGQLYYQALTLDAIGTSGNFSLTLNSVPNNAAVYSRFYGLDAGDVRGFETARTAVRDWSVGCAAADTACQDYRLSHGYVRYGDYYPGMAGWSSSGTRNAVNSTSDGVVFRKCSTCADFNAFASRPMVIDKRGQNGSMQHTQNYNCSGGGGGCSVSTTPVSYSSSRYSTSLPPGGPITQGAGDASKYYTTGAVNLGDARIEGLLINHMTLISCQAGGGC